MSPPPQTSNIAHKQLRVIVIRVIVIVRFPLQCIALMGEAPYPATTQHADFSWLAVPPSWLGRWWEKTHSQNRKLWNPSQHCREVSGTCAGTANSHTTTGTAVARRFTGR